MTPPPWSWDACSCSHFSILCMQYMYCMSCNEGGSLMRLSHSLVPFLSQHRFLAETRCEVTSTVSMTENHTDGTGTQARELVMVTLAQPVDGGHAGFRGRNVVGQRDRLGAEGMFGRQQELVAVAAGVGSQQQARASSLEQ